MKRKPIEFTKTEKALIKNKGIKKIERLGLRLNKHVKKNQNLKHINYKIFHLLHDPFTYINAYKNISKNKGSLTKGHEDEGIMEYFGRPIARKLAEQIKNGTFVFTAAKRTWIDKPGKNTKRPIDVPTQSNRIMQEAIRGILEAIFEPTFEELGQRSGHLCNNYGFRPKKSPWTAINILKLYAGRCNIVIEGDLISAFNHVDHHILLKLIKERVKDKKFLKLIWKMLKSGVMDNNTHKHFLTGTPQGGIASPLLLNIYLLGFDEYIFDNIIKPIFRENEEQEKKSKMSTEYQKLNRLMTKTAKELRNSRKDYAAGKIKNRLEVKDKKKTLKNLRNETFKIPSLNIKELPKKVVYVRYADDWVLTFTGTQKTAEEIKTKLADYLWRERKMELDPKKTQITWVSKGYKFVGFEIRLLDGNPKLRRVLMENKKKTFSRPLKRTTSRIISIKPDHHRILKRLKEKGFCDINLRPTSKAKWLVYTAFEIVQKYNQISVGTFNYYAFGGKINRLAFISYILKFSCAKTLARKEKRSMPKILKKYSTALRIIQPTMTLKETKHKKIEFYDITKFKRKLRKLKVSKLNPISSESDPFKITEHWRTSFKMYSECCICGSTRGVQMHHNNSLRSIKKRETYENIKSQTGRLQIPVCQKCHQDITHGRYNDSKKPIEFYNEFIARL